MATHFHWPPFEEAPACLYLEVFFDKADLHEFMLTHKPWSPLHDRVINEFRSPLVALAWKGYKPGLVAEKDVPVNIFGITILTPLEFREMQHGIRLRLNKAIS